MSVHRWKQTDATTVTDMVDQYISPCDFLLFFLDVSWPWTKFLNGWVLRFGLQDCGVGVGGYHCRRQDLTVGANPIGSGAYLRFREGVRHSGLDALRLRDLGTKHEIDRGLGWLLPPLPPVISLLQRILPRSLLYWANKLRWRCALCTTPWYMHR